MQEFDRITLRHLVVGGKPCILGMRVTVGMKNSREEKIRARDAKLKQDAENARMAKLYRKEILQEPELPGGFVAIGEIGGLGGIKPAAPVSKAEVVNNIEETVAGD